MLWMPDVKPNSRLGPAASLPALNDLVGTGITGNSQRMSKKLPASAWSLFPQGTAIET
jgi:hypothetical protein